MACKQHLDSRLFSERPSTFGAGGSKPNHVANPAQRSVTPIQLMIALQAIDMYAWQMLDRIASLPDDMLLELPESTEFIGASGKQVTVRKPLRMTSLPY